MREIKFRAWDTKTKKMIFTGFHVMGEVTCFGLIDQYIDENHCGADTSLDRWNDIKLMQYTGLKDCKGKEIYEGDILELKAQGSGYAVLNWVAVVEFGNPNGEYNWGWQLKPIKGVGINPDILLWVETEMPNVSCEIIGNIYETPELLRGENG